MALKADLIGGGRENPDHLRDFISWIPPLKILIIEPKAVSSLEQETLPSDPNLERATHDVARFLDAAMQHA